MSDAAPSQPCPWCATATSLEASVCARCLRSLLVDVRLDEPVTDARRRYQIARGLVALGAPVPPLPALQSALGTSSPLVVHGATRAFANRVRDLLEGNGLACRLVPTPVRRQAPWRRALLIAGASLVALATLTGGTLLVGLVLIRGLGLGRPSPAAPSPPPPSTTTPITNPAIPGLFQFPTELLYRRALPSTVSLHCQGSVGSGFFVSDDLVMTNAHVLCPAGEKIKVVFSDQHKLEGEPTHIDERLDLALLKVPGATAPPLPLGDVGTLKRGDRVITVGSPFGYEFTVHEGMVSYLNKSQFGIAYVEIDARVNPGNSGGPLIDREGRVVGIVSMKYDSPQGIGLALPINYSFTGAGAPLQPPAGVGDSPGFQTMLKEAEYEEKKAIAEVRNFDARQALVGIGQDQYRRVVLVIARRAHLAPAPDEVSVKVWRDAEVLCTLKADVREWKPADAKFEKEHEMDSRLKAWIERHDLEQHYYIGEAPLSSPCLRGVVEVELQNAQPEGARRRIGYYP